MDAETAAETKLHDSVKFKIQNKTDGIWIIAKRNDAEGVYYVTGHTDKETDATVFTPVTMGKSYGHIMVKGLEEDTYTIIETQTANGYTLLKNAITVTITVNEDNMLVITNDGRKLALDQRLINPMLPDSDTGKVAVCAENVYNIWERTAEKKSTQMVFVDLSTPHNDGQFNVYDDLKKKLLDRGIPESEIAYIHDAKTEAAKKELFGKVRSGEIRVLIGSTQKMGAGTNAQRKLIALHHMDCPWRPSDLQQREGRIIRQGNENPKVDIYTYVTEREMALVLPANGRQNSP